MVRTPKAESVVSQVNQMKPEEKMLVITDFPIVIPFFKEVSIFYCPNPYFTLS